MFQAMEKDRVLAKLKANQAELQRLGVQHAALFGSTARGQSGRKSDVDILVDLDPEAHLSVFDYVDVKDFIAGLFDGPVDVVNKDGLKSFVKPGALADAIYAF